MNIKETNARAWQIKVSDKMKNTVTANVSTYEGKDQKDEPVYSSWNARFVGDAYKKAKKLDEGKKFAILSANITTYYDKKNDKNYTNLTIFEIGEPILFESIK